MLKTPKINKSNSKRKPIHLTSAQLRNSNRTQTIKKMFKNNKQSPNHNSKKRTKTQIQKIKSKSKLKPTVNQAKSAVSTRTKKHKIDPTMTPKKMKTRMKKKTMMKTTTTMMQDNLNSDKLKHS